MTRLIGIFVTLLAFLFLTVLSTPVLSDVICACYNKEHGQLRIVSDHSKCLPAELPLYLYGTTEPEPGNLPTYIGDRCWQTNSGCILTLAFTQTGDGRYILNGRFDDPFEDRTEALSGSAEVVGDKIYMIINSAGESDSGSFAYINRCVLDSETFDGTWQGFGIAHNKLNPDPDNAELDIGTGTLTSIPCP